MDFDICDDASESKFRLCKLRNLKISLDGKSLERIHVDKSDHLDLNVNIEKCRNEAILLKPNIDIKSCDRMHFNETSADNEKHEKILSNSITGIDMHFDKSMQDDHHYDNHLPSDTQESGPQGSPSRCYVDLDEVTAIRRLTENSGSLSSFELDDSYEREPHSRAACIHVRNGVVERTPFDNPAYCVDVDGDITDRSVSHSTYRTKHERRPLDTSTYCDVSVNDGDDVFERGLVTCCFNETDGRRCSNSYHCDGSLENVASRRLIDSTSCPGNFYFYSDRRPLENSANHTEPDTSTLEMKQSDSDIYYELDFDAVLQWSDSMVGSRSADDRIELGRSDTRHSGHGISHDCLICLEKQTTVSRRKCCKFPVCRDCLETYYATKVSMAVTQVQCIGTGCNKYVSQSEILSCLTADLQERFMQLLVDANRDPRRKTCPRCNCITELDPQTLKEHGNRKYGLRHLCSVCNLIWCFKCQAPWHDPLSCRDFQRGDRQFKAWTKQLLEGQANAQKCPKCKVYIQRNGGCDHMTCLRCSTDFCYQCGEKYRQMKFIGDHRSPYSILGCKYRYKPDSPVKRRLVRGSIFGGKLLAAPIVGSLALGAGAVVVGLGLVVLPFYGGYKLHKMMQQKRKEKVDVSEKYWRDFWDAKSFEDFHHMEEIGELNHDVITIYDREDNDDYSYKGDNSINEELEESAECQNNLSPLLQSGDEVPSKADALDLGDTSALSSHRFNLHADSEVLDGSYDGAESAAIVRTAGKLPRRFCRTYLIDSTELVMDKNAGSNENAKQRNLSGSQDMAAAEDNEVVSICDEVTHL